MEFAGSPFEIKSLSETGHIEGLLAGFGNVDHGGDRLMPGCLSKSLAARRNPLPMLLHHDLHRPIGAWKEWSERPDGLYVVGNMTLGTRDAQEAHALAKDGALTGLSIGWQSIKETRDAAGVRNVTEAALFEGSLVSIPMNDKTRVTSILPKSCRRLAYQVAKPRQRQALHGNPSIHKMTRRRPMPNSHEY
jgi:uncharacterized protein